MNDHTRACERCGETFASPIAARRFCTERCRKRAEESRREKRKPKAPPVGRLRPTECRDCGSFDINWWMDRGWKHPGAAGSRCHPCYRRYTRQRQTPGSISDGRKLGPLKPPGRKLIVCVDCQLLFPARNQSKRCVPCSMAYDVTRRGVAHARRRQAERNGDSDINWRTLGPRDSWRCHLCGGKVPKVGGTAKQPKGATVDHLEPISEGGPHVWSNVALAHRHCNISRQAGGIVQLRLVG